MKEIKNSYDAVDKFPQELRTNTHEECWVMLLNEDNEQISNMMVKRGDNDSVELDCRSIVKSALDCDAYGVILCHNHPRGIPFPSTCDIKLTEKLRDGCKLFDISLLDHIIISKNGFYSFNDEVAHKYKKVV